MTSTGDNVVLVTGGGGCLGQHLIGLLQTRAPHVTEVRVLDIKPYKNKLGNVSVDLFPLVKDVLFSIIKCHIRLAI